MMKIKCLFVCFLVAMASCNNVKEQEVSEQKIEKNMLPVIKDNVEGSGERVVVYDEEGNELSYSLDELKKIEILFPVFKEDVVRDPKEAYWFSGVWKEYLDEKGVRKSFSFGSEAGQDDFYLLYAHYLKKQNGEEDYKKERKILTELYRTVNAIYASLNYGGTYFGHQHKRLVAEVEYSIYLLKSGGKDYRKEYAIKKQKTVYLNSIIQYIEDEESQNIEIKMNAEEGKNRAKKFKEQVDVIEKLTTDYFYLNRLQKFEIQNYR